MDGENNGKPYEQMDDLGVPGTPYFWVDTHMDLTTVSSKNTFDHFELSTSKPLGVMNS